MNILNAIRIGSVILAGGIAVGVLVDRIVASMALIRDIERHVNPPVEE